MARKRPDVEWVAEQWPTLNKIDAGPTVQALAQARPEAIFNVTFAADLSQFVREGATRGLFRDRKVVSLLTGEPEYLDLLKVEAPTGWLVTGYPWHAIDTPEHKAFLEAYLAKFNDYPRLASVIGYATLKAVAAILAKAGSTDAEKMAAAEGVGVDTPFGPITFTFRVTDHQSTMGAYVGRTALEDGKGIMADWHYADGADYLPSPEEVKKLRPSN